jgi:nicotinate-nucleotide adenylyltransferase
MAVGVGVLGGVFDPPHLGHVALARAALEQLELDRLLVLVVGDPGHKRTTTPARTRLDLARLAFAADPRIEVQLDPHERTVDSLEALALDDPVFVVGADEFADFSTWKRPDRVLELARLAVATRPGVTSERVREAHARLPTPDRVSFFETPAVPVSSTAVRERVARGEPIDELVPREVADAVRRLQLYAVPEYTEPRGERTQTD